MFVKCVILFIICTTGVIFSDTIEIEDNFQFCHIDLDQKPIDTNDLCMLKAPFNQDLIQNYSILLNRSKIQFAVLSRSDNNINGKGYECEMFLHKRSYHESWLFAKTHRDESIETVILSEVECRNMVKNKKCGEEDLICDNDGCRYLFEPKDDESYWTYFSTTDPVITFRTCRINFKNIISHSLNDMMFSHNCYLKNYVCILENSIVVWDKSIQNECPFVNVFNATFKLEGKFFTDEEDKFSFEYLQTEKICNLNSIKTTDGLNLINLDLFGDISKKLIQNSDLSSSEFQTFNRLNLGERDYYRFKNNKEQKEFTKYECEMYVESINNQKQYNNFFFKKHDIHFVEKIFFVKNFQIYIPLCIGIKKIILDDTFLKFNNTCDIYPKATFDYMGNIIKGFYNWNGILSSYALKKTCPLESIYIPMPSHNKFILQRGSKYSLVSKEKANLKILNINNFQSTSSIEFQHSRLFLKKLSSGLFETVIHNDNPIVENHPLFKLYKKSIVNDIYVFSRSMILKLSLLWSNITLLCIIVIIIILFFIFYKYKKSICCCFKNDIRLNERIISRGLPSDVIPIVNAPPVSMPPTMEQIRLQEYRNGRFSDI
jgi:hypothetical protein